MGGLAAAAHRCACVARDGGREGSRPQRRSTGLGFLQRAFENGRQSLERFAFRPGLSKRFGDQGLGLQRNAPRTKLKGSKLYPVIDFLVLDHVDHVDQSSRDRPGPPALQRNFLAEASRWRGLPASADLTARQYRGSRSSSQAGNASSLRQVDKAPGLQSAGAHCTRLGERGTRPGRDYPATPDEWPRALPGPSADRAPTLRPVPARGR